MPKGTLSSIKPWPTMKYAYRRTNYGRFEATSGSSFIKARSVARVSSVQVFNSPSIKASRKQPRHRPFNDLLSPPRYDPRAYLHVVKLLSGPSCNVIVIHSPRPLLSVARRILPRPFLRLPAVARELVASIERVSYLKCHEGFSVQLAR